MKASNSVRRAAFCAGACAAALAAATPVAAQQGSGSAASEEDAARGIDEIVVTAQKRVENAQDVPIAITALGSEDIASSGVTGVADLRIAVPALNVTRGTGGFGLPRIRGIGATGQGNGIENPVAVYVDGVYYAAASGVLQSLFDTEQVAVLKGPQGTLFGRNATGGLIQISTLNPRLGEASGKAQVGYANFETLSGAGFVSLPLAETVAVSFSGQYEKRFDGYGRNVVTGNDVQDPSSWAGRMKLLWEPGADTRVLLSADFNGTDDSAPAFVTFSRNTVGQDVQAVIASMGGDPRYDIYADVDPELRARQWGTSLTVSHDFAGMSLKSITAYRDTKLYNRFDPDGTILPQLRIINNNTDRNFTQEVNLISDDNGPVKWVIGGFYMNNRSGQGPARTTGTTQFADNGYNDEINSVDLESWSAFVEGSYALGDSTNVTAGVRYTDDTRTLNATKVAFNGATNTTTTTVFPEEQRKFRKVSWKLSADHRFSPELMVYASYNRGFRAGTFVPQADPVTILEPEVVDAFELGLKSDLLDRRVRLNLAAYHYDQSSVQVMQVIAGVQNVYSARGGARIYGIDGDLTVQPTDNLRLFGGFAWNHARYKSFTDAIISIPFPLSQSLGAAGAAAFSTTNYSYVSSGTGASIANTVCLGTFVPPNLTTQAARDGFYRGRPGGNCLLRGDASGNRLQNTPDWTFSLGGNLDMPTSAGKFSLAGNLAYNGGYVGTPDERVQQGAFTIVNASLTWRSPDDGLYARLWANNLTNAFYRTQIGATNSGDNGTAGAPRTYGVTIGFEF